MYHWYEPVQQWYVVMNSCVHSFMYSYYALRSLKIRVPRPIAMFITTIQLLQMVLGVTVSIYSYWIMSGTWIKKKRKKLTRWAQKFLWTQISDKVFMFWGCCIENPANCPHRNWFGLKVSFAIYVPYTILFAKLFLDSYLVKPKSRPVKNGQATNGVHDKAATNGHSKHE